MSKQYVTLETASNMRGLGFNEWCETCFTIYDEDFVYDSDPEHPESHKKGEVGYYKFTNRNLNNGSTCTSLPTFDEAFEWFRSRGVHVCTEPVYNPIEDTFGYKSYIITKDGRHDIVTEPMEYNDCLDFTLYKATDYVK